MIKCSICNKNIAVVFVTKIIDGKQIQEGLCVSCAKKQNLQPIDQLLSQTGMTEYELDNISKQVGDMLEEMDGSEIMEAMQVDPENINQANPFFSILNKAFPKPDDIEANNSKSLQPIGQDKDGDDKDKNSTKTKAQDKKTVKKKKYLEMYGTNLIDKAKEGSIDKIIGRAREIERVIQILNRRTKNNPVLIGEPGVGKTAIAEGLALRIAEKTVPVKIQNSEVYLLDMTSVVAGTQFRGQFESRMKGIIEEAKSFGNIILVIDELHNIMGAGEAEGAMNAANILKPALSRGEIQVIGATTLNEYRKHIEKDTALERRFQPIIVDEPSIGESIEILTGIKHYYEQYHRVKISDEIVKAAVNYSERYITDRLLPDKAIDVIDEAGSRANLRNTKLAELESYKEELKKVQEEKEFAVSADSIEDYQKAADLKVYECKLNELIKDIEDTSKDVELTMEDIAAVIEAWTKIPIQRLTEGEAEKLMSLETRIHKRVIGQEKAVEGVARAIRRSRSGFKKKKKPSSFIFVGPTGVGKTELVRALSNELFGSEEALIRLDMSEYMEKHTVSKLIGSPPGYVGYDDAGQLTEKVRRRPYSVILLDEIEKAHPDVFNMLLQILEDGRLTDSHGKTVNFENTIIIMTSNAGTNLKSGGIGFSNNTYTALESRVRDVIKETFRPEFLNRIDEIIVFTELGKEELKKIIDLMLEEVYHEAREKDIRVNVSDKVKEFILEKGYDPKFGARPLRRTVQSYIEDRLSEEYLKGTIKEGSLVGVDLDDNNEVILTIV
ncbi:ATPase AAA-2 domain protein [Ruminiclostridium papyrosolvens DSM 2782]|uniref:ATPase AAA-2 domain protein n=1 Tax=Ruminiclostridium papyrosolvens DSM 2782 TaxID=588581 RepID=F1THW6_9FIRM|nr:AAA family ATPase [Ruminiclostridium papyrosolvens]EGD46098.1 ATPase AAA-2 domain protein [Ruminiclostridium papyrosolvens DSM 2782]WES32897.1 AAA family ATPase [Ruminiclostridium papyrosolvens DSM 2782]